MPNYYLSLFRHCSDGPISATALAATEIANQIESGGLLVGPAYSLGLLLAQDSAQTLNVARDDGQCDVSLEAHNPMIRTDVQTMLLQRIDC